MQALGCSPFAMIPAREPTLPSDVWLGTAPLGHDSNNYGEQLTGRLTKIRALASEVHETTKIGAFPGPLKTIWSIIGPQKQNYWLCSVKTSGVQKIWSPNLEAHSNSGPPIKLEGQKNWVSEFGEPTQILFGGSLALLKKLCTFMLIYSCADLCSINFIDVSTGQFFRLALRARSPILLISLKPRIRFASR
jgi:hypothetical protein